MAGAHRHWLRPRDEWKFPPNGGIDQHLENEFFAFQGGRLQSFLDY